MFTSRLLTLTASLILATIVATAVVPTHPTSKVRASASPSSTDGVDLVGMDRSIRPGDNFFAYANGAWLKATKIPPDRSSYGVDARLSEEANLRTRALLEEAAKSTAAEGSDERKVGDYYAAYMNEEVIEAKGLVDLKGQLDRVAAISDRRTLAESIAQTIRADVDPLNNTNFHTQHVFGVWVAQDFNHPMRYTFPIFCRGGSACRTASTTSTSPPAWQKSELSIKPTSPPF